MFELANVLEWHPDLPGTLREFDRLELCIAFSALLSFPKCHANTLRLEVLVHLAFALADGESKPSRANINAITNTFGPRSPISRSEDPAEDVFVGYIASNLGGFRVLNGLLASGEMSVTHLLDLLSAENVPESVTRLISPVRAFFT